MSSTDFEPSADPEPSSALLAVEGAFDQHPLTAVTTAMLNINGASEDSPGGGFNVFYDIYGKTLSEGNLLKTDRNVTSADIWSPVASSNKLTHGDMTEVFVTNSSKLSSVLRHPNKLKLNGHHSNTDGGVIVVKEELPHSPPSPSRLNGILGVADPDAYPAFATLNSTHYDYGAVVSSPQQFTLRSTGYVTTNEPYYRDYFPPDYAPSNATRVISGYDGPSAQLGAEAYRATLVGGPYKNPVTIDVNSPDSGIGAESITPRDHSTAQQGFDYNEMVGQSLMGEMSGGSSNAGSATGRSTPASNPSQQKATRPWHEFGRTSETDKIQIPKLFLSCGFRYYLESPISTSQRREDDRITYINKGQFYGITLDLVPEPDKPLKSQTVKSVVMLVFREEKSPEDEIKAWQFWHSRQHSVKQRILDADTKNSVGLVGCIDEVAHNAIAVYWNPLESSAKINVAVQCLSTDFSSQKGVKGLPLHLQIDTYDDPRDPNCPIYHRGYSQIKVFCDKGAERKTRDEERRAAKRKLTATGRKKLDELYHTSCDRTEFYAMSELAKPPVLFSPAEDLDKVNLTPLAEFHGYYGGGGGNSESNDNSTTEKAAVIIKELDIPLPLPPPSSSCSDDFGSPSLKRLRLAPPHPTERLMIFLRQEGEDIFTPVHLVPPTTLGLLAALEDKFKISMGSVKNLFRRSAKGIVAKVDDEMLKHYCHEDTFLLEVKASENEDAFDLTIVEQPLNLDMLPNP